jgi:Cu-Zn family superoxide dismutase
MQRFGSVGFIALLAIASAGAAWAQDTMMAQGNFISNAGKGIGTVSFNSGPNGLVVSVELMSGDIKPGMHGIHMHEVADCSDTEKFEKAKAHAKREGQSHGYLNAEGPEAGDLSNLLVAQDGSAKAEFATSLANLSGENSILDEDGFAVIIHERHDDYKDKDSAGARIACAEIKKP